MKNSRDSHTELFIKTYRSFLRGGGLLKIKQIIKPYQKMRPLLHKGASSKNVDIGTFIYTFLRLPEVVWRVKKIILAQTEEIFRREGYKIEFWEEVSAPVRRRKMLFDGQDTLGVFINSVADVDDLVCLLTAFQIEWNKIRFEVRGSRFEVDVKNFAKALKISKEDRERLGKIWWQDFDKWIERIKRTQVDFKIQLLRGNWVDYQKAAQNWFANILQNTKYSIAERPLYFVSSNTHSLVNNITGFVNQLEGQLITFLKKEKMKAFLEYWQQIEKGDFPGSRENFLWYILKKYEKKNPDERKKRWQYEKDLGIDYIEAGPFLDINAQVIDISQLPKSGLGKKLGKDIGKLAKSRGLILNIDYPLGFGAYMVLSTVLRNVADLRGVYILGKASFFSGNLGDIALPTQVFDAYSDNTYVFKNAFDKRYFKIFRAGSVLTNQKVVSVRGTLLTSDKTMADYFKAGYAVLEMEDGPYLNAIHEMCYYHRYPERQTINLINSPVDIGIIHYASDTPFTKAITLATRNLGYEGVEATYVSSLAILKRIIEREIINT